MANLTKQNVRGVLPCFGHFDLMHCYNLGFVGPPLKSCPYQRLCRKEYDLQQRARREFLKFQEDSGKGRKKMLEDKATIGKRREKLLEEKLEDYSKFGSKIKFRRR